MKNSGNLKNVFRTALFVAGIMILQSCVVYRPNSEQLVSVPDIIKMSKDGLSSKDIIREINQSHTVYSLRADQLVNLRDEGVQDSVLNYMEETKIKAIQQNQRYSASPYWRMAADGFFYGAFGFWGPYGYFGWNMAPTIIFSASRMIGGGYHGGGSHGGSASHVGTRR
jgi:hypothetical protein